MSLALRLSSCSSSYKYDPCPNISRIGPAVSRHRECTQPCQAVDMKYCIKSHPPPSWPLQPNDRIFEYVAHRSERWYIPSSRPLERSSIRTPFRRGPRKISNCTSARAQARRKASPRPGLGTSPHRHLPRSLRPINISPPCSPDSPLRALMYRVYNPCTAIYYSLWSCRCFSCVQDLGRHLGGRRVAEEEEGNSGYSNTARSGAHHL